MALKKVGFVTRAEKKAALKKVLRSEAKKVALSFKKV